MMDSITLQEFPMTSMNFSTLQHTMDDNFMFSTLPKSTQYVYFEWTTGHGVATHPASFSINKVGYLAFG